LQIHEHSTGDLRRLLRLRQRCGHHELECVCRISPDIANVAAKLVCKIGANGQSRYRDLWTHVKRLVMAMDCLGATAKRDGRTPGRGLATLWLGPDSGIHSEPQVPERRQAPEIPATHSDRLPQLNHHC
jgi:hypothetical protein